MAAMAMGKAEALKAAKNYVPHYVAYVYPDGSVDAAYDWVRQTVRIAFSVALDRFIGYACGQGILVRNVARDFEAPV